LGLRTCSKCKLDLPPSKFRFRTKADGRVEFKSDCDECHKAYNRALRERQAQTKGKECLTREEWKKERAETAREKKNARLEKWRLQQEGRVEARNAQHITCIRCHTKKPRREFYESVLANGQRRCKACSKERDAARFQALKADAQRYARRLSNPVRLLRNRTDSTMRAALLRRGASKDPGVFRHLDYSLNDLRLHLERTFAKGMNWENMKEWHIDHIVPVSSFEFNTAQDEGFRRCYALSNLRAMWAEDNLSKGAKRLFLC
jgi:hypothetical protein